MKGKIENYKLLPPLNSSQGPDIPHFRNLSTNPTTQPHHHDIDI